MSIKPKISVIMAARNSAQTIARAIESILIQSLTDWELIIVDDASTDDTLKIARSYLESRITLLHLPSNAGAGAARNRALQVARAEFFAVMDADDIATEQRLQVAVEMLTHDSDLVVAAGQVAEFGDWGGPVTSTWPTDNLEIRQRQRARKTPVPHPSSSMRLLPVTAVGGYDEFCRRSQDYALFLRLGNSRIACTREVVLHYRTFRPLKLSYAIESGRFANLARRRNAIGGMRPDPLPRSCRRFPASFSTDMLSTAQWLRRRLRES